MADWGSIIKIALDAYSGYRAGKESERVAKESSKPRTATTMRIPYGNEYISPLVKYVLENQQNIFANRMREYGAQPADFEQYRGLLAGVPTGYSGVGTPGAPVMNAPMGGAPSAGGPAPGASAPATAMPTAQPTPQAQAAAPQVAPQRPQMENYWDREVRS